MYSKMDKAKIIQSLLEDSQKKLTTVENSNNDEIAKMVFTFDNR
jgi:hypothetical protein